MRAWSKYCLVVIPPKKKELVYVVAHAIHEHTPHAKFRFGLEHIVRVETKLLNYISVIQIILNYYVMINIVDQIYSYI